MLHLRPTRELVSYTIDIRALLRSLMFYQRTIAFAQLGVFSSRMPISACSSMTSLL